MDPMISEALQYIQEVQTKLTGDGRRHIYDQFIQTLKQFRCRSIDSSTVVSTVQELFQNHPDLLEAFKPFMPSHSSAAAPAAEEGSDTRVVDFLSRVYTRFGGGEVYRKFSDCMHAYSRAEISGSGAGDKVAGLFGDNDDLVAEFMRLVPGSCVQEGSNKRKIDRVVIDRDQERGKRRSGSDSGSLDDDDRAAAPRRRQQMRKSKRIVGRDNEMEDSLCDIDVRIGNLESVRRKALKLADRLHEGRLSPTDVRLDEQFTPLNLAFIRKLDRKILGHVEHHLLHGLGELMEILMRKNESLENERLKIVQKWRNIRQSHLN